MQLFGKGRTRNFTLTLVGKNYSTARKNKDSEGRNERKVRTYLNVGSVFYQGRKKKGGPPPFVGPKEGAKKT